MLINEYTATAFTGTFNCRIFINSEKFSESRPERFLIYKVSVKDIFYGFYQETVSDVKPYHRLV